MNQQDKETLYNSFLMMFVIEDQDMVSIDKYLAIRECIDLLDEVYKETGKPLIYTHYKSKKKYPSKYNVNKLDRNNFNSIKDGWKAYHKTRQHKDEEFRERRKQYNIYIGIYPHEYEDIEEFYMYALKTRLQEIEESIKKQEADLNIYYNTRDSFKQILNK